MGWGWKGMERMERAKICFVVPLNLMQHLLWLLLLSLCSTLCSLLDSVQIALCSNETARDKNLRDLMRIDLSSFTNSDNNEGEDTSTATTTTTTTTTTSRVLKTIGLSTTDSLIQILDNLTFAQEVTVAMYIREIFNRLFILLTLFQDVPHGGEDGGLVRVSGKSGSEATPKMPVAQEIFCVLMQTIGRLTGSRSNPKHVEALEIYIQECFHTSNTQLYTILVNQATQLMQWLDDTDHRNAEIHSNSTKQRRTISAMMRCFEYVMKISIAAGLKAHAITQSSGHGGEGDGEGDGGGDGGKSADTDVLTQTFKHKLEQLMYYADSLMKKTTPKWIQLVQEHCVSNFVRVFEHLQIVFNQPELGEIVRGFIESIPHDLNQRVSLRIKKLIFVHKLMKSSCNIFVHNSSRKSCMAAVVRMLQVRRGEGRRNKQVPLETTSIPDNTYMRCWVDLC